MATVQEIVEDLSFQIGDTVTYTGTTVTDDGSRITEARWIIYLQAALQELVKIRPDIKTETVVELLTANTTRQSLPTGALKLIDGVRNMGSDGATPGDVVTVVKRRFLDQSVPSWHSAIGTTYIDHYTYDLKNPLEYFVYPRPHATTPVYLELEISTLPDTPTVSTDTIDVSSQFIETLKHYMMYRAYMIDDDEVNQTRAMHHYNAFIGSLGQEVSSSLVSTPIDKQGPKS